MLPAESFQESWKAIAEEGTRSPVDKMPGGRSHHNGTARRQSLDHCQPFTRRGHFEVIQARLGGMYEDKAPLHIGSESRGITG